MIQRGNNRAPIFFSEDDYAQYRQWLIAAAEDYGLIVHAHVFMTNHVHLLVTPETAESLPRTDAVARPPLRALCQCASQAHGNAVGGPLPGGARSTREEFFVTCCRYVELNPVRARMVAHPRQYRWSSYRAHAEGADDALARFHDAFRRLGRSVAERQAAYRALIRETLDPTFVDALRAATNGGWALGGERFRKQAEAAAQRRAAPLPPGPKPKAKNVRQMRL